VAEYTATYPYVNLKVVEAYSAVLTDGVRREELDLAIVPPVAADPRLRSSFVSRDREMFVTSARSRRPHLATVSMADVGPLRLILPSRGNARRARLDDYLKGIGAAVEAVLEMDAMMGTLELIATSDWVSILPATLCFPDIARGPRRVHPLVDPPLTVDYVLITPAARAVSPAAAAFAAVLSRHIRLIGIAWDQRLRHQKN
jgi:LysR family transcriptional regulator, nitrogen assimilation regulatory protein